MKMNKPDIIALPTSQMMAFCDVLGLPPSVQDNTESMIVALEAADFSGLEMVKPKKGEARPANGIGFVPDKMGAAIVAKRKAALGRV